MDLYRRMAAIRSEEDADDLLDEIVDRYGEPPKGVLNLIDIALLRANARKAGVKDIKQQAEMFAFYRVPKVLFTEDCFWNVSTDAKLLYGILLDRMNLSARNGWLDEEGRVYIIFTIEEIKGALGCAEKKAVKLLDELEKKCGLIERKRQGLGKPNLIYVKNFISGSVERQFLNCQKDNSGVVKNTIQELSKAQGNNTDTNYIDFSDTDPFFPSGFCGKEVDETDEFTRYYQYFYEQLSMDYLKQDYPYDHEILDLILHLIIEVMCSNRKQIRIAIDDKAPYMAGLGLFDFLWHWPNKR